ncbi:hypothetical protein [Actinacidiphila glaucinigra]|uniref:hypothetical protein n=1 Tax=Actinacidiphila glaucinigra TaxID=235986 RepID=UPI003D8A4877
METLADGHSCIVFHFAPQAAFDDLVAVAGYVSRGRQAAFAQDAPYPKAMSRRALGALADASIIQPSAEAPVP